MIRKLLTSAAALVLLGAVGLSRRNKKKPEILPEHFSFQGHRGARGLSPENTIPSFLKCLELGVPAFELDVVISQDKQVVVSHEGWYSHKNTTKPDGNPLLELEEMDHLIYQMPYERVKQYDCGKLGHPDFPKQKPLAAHKPLLRDVIEACDTYAEENLMPSVLYNIEVKSFKNGAEGYGKVNPAPIEFARLVCDVVEEMGIKNRAIIQSFDPAIVRALRACSTGCALSLLVDNVEGIDQNLERLGFVPEVYAPYYKLITRSMVVKAHRKGMKVITWTVNDSDTMRKLVKKGVDGIITDYPNLKFSFIN